MRLTGFQVEKVAEIADGTAIKLKRTKGQTHVDLTRIEDDLQVRIHFDGETTTLQEARTDGA